MENEEILLSVDLSEPITVEKFREINAEAVRCKVKDLDKQWPFNEITRWLITAKVGDIWLPVKGGMGANIKRVK